MSLWKKKSDHIKKKPNDSYFFDLIETINWVEIPVLDIERAVSFYTNVFHCKFDFHEFNDTKYAFFKFKSGSVKGTLVQVDTPIPSTGVKLYFNVDAILSKIIKKVELNKGKVIQQKSLIKNSLKGSKSIIPVNSIDGKIGYLTIIEDSEGNRLMLHSNS